MSVVGQLERPRGIGKYKVSHGSATGPAADVSVAATSAADISITISIGFTNLERGGIERITGLPDGVVLVGFSMSATAITIRVYNTTAGAITVTAGSITVSFVAIGY